MTIGEKLRAERKAKGLSISDVTARCGIDPSTVSKYERGVYKPTAAIIGKLAAALEIEPETITRGADAAPQTAAKTASEKQAKCKSGGVRWYSVDEKKPTLPCLILNKNSTLQIVTKRIISVEAPDGTLYFNGLHGLREEDIKPTCGFRYWMPIPEIPTDDQ